MSLSWSWETSCRHTALTGFPFFTTLGGQLSPVLQCKRVFSPSSNDSKGYSDFWLVGCSLGNVLQGIVNIRLFVCEKLAVIVTC